MNLNFFNRIPFFSNPSNINSNYWEILKFGKLFIYGGRTFAMANIKLRRGYILTTNLILHMSYSIKAFDV